MRRRKGLKLGLIIGVGQVVLACLLLSQYVSLTKWYIMLTIAAFSLGPLIFGRIFDELRYYADLDPLTQVANRRSLPTCFRLFTQKARKNKLKCSVHIIDINEFKQINDRYGHSFGDTVLVEVAKAIRKNVRKEDLVVRFGGDEFLVLSLFRKETTASELEKRVKKELLHVSNKLHYPVRISIGYAIYPNHGIKLMELIQIADQNMYNQKQQKVLKMKVKQRA